MSTQTLNMLLDLANDKLETAVRVLSIERRTLSAEKDKLEMLLSYYDQYQDTTRSQAKTGVTAIQMRNATEFLQRLGAAIDQQKAEVKLVGERLDQCSQELIDAQTEVKKYQLLLDRKAEEASRMAHRREQKMNDEMAARLVRQAQE